MSISTTRSGHEEEEAPMEPGLEEPLEEEAPMEPPITAGRSFIGCSLVCLAFSIFNNYLKIEDKNAIVIKL